MAKKVIDIFPPRNRAINDKPSSPRKEEETITPDVRLSEEAPLSELRTQVLENEPAVSQPEAAIESEPAPVQPQIKPLPQPQPKPRITFMGNRQDFSLEEGDDSAWGKIKKALFWVVLAGVAAAGVMFAIDLRVARAVVKVWPATSNLSDQVQVTIDPAAQSVNQDEMLIPGLILTVEDTITGETEVTGKKDTQGKATGTVKIVNNYTSQQRLVKGTRLEADKSKFKPALTADENPWFRTTQDVILEPKTSATVSVIADGSGEKFNIEPSVFSIPGLVGTAQYTFVYAQSYEKFQGGSTGSAPSVTQADLDAAQQAITGLAETEMQKKLMAEVPQGYILVEETKKTEFNEADIQAKVGDSLGKITSQITGKITGVAYRKADIESLGKDYILSKVPQGSVAYQNNLQVSSSYQESETAGEKTVLNLTAQVPVYPGLADNELKKGLSEKSAQEAKLFLENQGMRVQIQFTPPWRTTIPRDLDRIEVQTIIE